MPHALTGLRFYAVLESVWGKVTFLLSVIVEPNAINRRAIVGVVHHAVNDHSRTARLQLHKIAFFPLPNHGASCCNAKRRLALFVFEEFASHYNLHTVTVRVGLS